MLPPVRYLGFSVELFATSDCTGRKLTFKRSVCLPKNTIVRSVRFKNPQNKKLYARLLSACDHDKTVPPPFPGSEMDFDYKTWDFNVEQPPAKMQSAPKTSKSSGVVLRFYMEGQDVKYEGIDMTTTKQTTIAQPAPTPAPGNSILGSCIPIDTSAQVFPADPVKPKDFVKLTVQRFDLGPTCTDCNGRNCSGVSPLLLGDGTCHNGTYSTGFNFECLKFEFDRGDCAQRYQFTPRMLVIQHLNVPPKAPRHSICAAYGEPCFCNNKVRYGNGKVWTQWRSVERSNVGFFKCNIKAFDFVKADKVVKLVRRAVGSKIPKSTDKQPFICQCMTSEPVTPCAQEGGMCDCKGKMQYFTEKSVSEMVPTSGLTKCTNSSFRGVFRGKDKPLSTPGQCACIPQQCNTNSDCGSDYWCQTNEGLTLSKGDSCASGEHCYCTGRITKNLPKANDFKLQLKSFAYPDANLGQTSDRKCLKVAIKARTNSSESRQLEDILTLIDRSSRIFSMKKDVNLESVLKVPETLYKRVTQLTRRQLSVTG